MTRSPRQFQPFNRCATHAARLTCSIVHPSNAAVVAVNALNVKKIAKRGAASVEGVLQDLNNGGVQALNLL